MNLFQTREYLAVFAKHFCRQEDIVDGIWEKYQGGLVLLGMKPVLGKEEVTDFAHTGISVLPGGYRWIRLDYVREDSQTFLNFKAKAVKTEVSPYLNLPGSWEDYLNQLEREKRKELRRKFRRLNEAEHEFVTADEPEELIRLHRLSDPNKQQFMSPEMAGFFRDLYREKIPGWKTELNFLKIDGRFAAGIISFSNQDEFWLYNSGYDPAFAYYSAGLVLKAWSIKKAIEAGKSRYDFLRGSERYKYDLGAKDLNLYRIEINQ